MPTSGTEPAGRGWDTPGVKVGLVIAAGAVLLLVGYLVLAAQSGSTARGGTVVAGVDISGLSEAEAAAKVEDALNPAVRKRIHVDALGQKFVIRPAKLGVLVDGEASVAPAYGRTWNPVTLVTGMFGGQELPLQIDVDESVIRNEVRSIADAIDVAPIEPQISVRNGRPVVMAGEAGRTLDVDATTAAVVAALPLPRTPVEAMVTKSSPAIDEGVVKQAEDFIAAATSGPITVQADSVTAEIGPKTIGRALTVTLDESGFTPTLDGEILHEAIADQLAAIEDPGSDATFRIKNGKSRVVKSKVGRGVSDDELAQKVATVLANPAGQREVAVSVGLREPALTTEQAEQLGVVEKLSSFTQNFPYAAYRVQNIGEAASRVNGTLLMPGETFSMNDVIKERTEENGYTVGFVVGEGGVFDEQLGGGVSAATTTVWTGAFFAGLERVFTQAHSIYISRYQPGLEATVAWGIFDMKFRNDTPNAVFITTSMSNTSMTVSFWGTKQYDEIDAEFGPKTNTRKFATIYDDSKDCLGQEGVDGFTITVDRVFYKDGKEVKREPITTTYKAAPKVICGEKPKKDKKDEPNPSASPSASDSPGGKPSSSASPSNSGKPAKPEGSGKPAKPSPSADGAFDNSSDD